MMKFPETPTDIKNEIQISVEKQNSNEDLRIRQLIKLLSKVSHEMIVEGVLLLIEDKNGHYQEQQAACKILTELNPKTTADLTKIVSRIIGTWNKSCKEIIFWMVENYGVDQVRKCFSDLEIDLNSEYEIDTLSIMKYWLRAVGK